MSLRRGSEPLFCFFVNIGLRHFAIVVHFVLTSQSEKSKIHNGQPTCQFSVSSDLYSTLHSGTLTSRGFVASQGSSCCGSFMTTAAVKEYGLAPLIWIFPSHNQFLIKELNCSHGKDQCDRKDESISKGFQHFLDVTHQLSSRLTMESTHVENVSVWVQARMRENGEQLIVLKEIRCVTKHSQATHTRKCFVRSVRAVRCCVYTSCTPTQFLHIRCTRNHFACGGCFVPNFSFCESSKKTSVTCLQASDHRVCGGSELCTLFGVSRRETVNQPCPYLLTTSSSQLHTIPLAVILPRLTPTHLPHWSTRPNYFHRRNTQTPARTHAYPRKRWTFLAATRNTRWRETATTWPELWPQAQGENSSFSMVWVPIR